MSKIDVDKELAKEDKAYRRKHKPTRAEIAFNKEWVKRTRHVCKPCWELRYCPYGPLVEQFPVMNVTRDEMREHHEFLKQQLAKRAYMGWRKKYFEDFLAHDDLRQYPKTIPEDIFERSCTIFGHICPVFFVNEPFTETEEERRITRYIPRDVMLRVARRDDYCCQKCGRHLGDNEIEFHHKIPFSKGGSTEENNLQLACYDCNRSWGTKVSGLAEWPPTSKA
jgi:hypothetical protein